MTFAMISNCLLCGVGGQGTVLASKLIAAAAMEKGLEVKTAETIGMSQRGGCVASHVRVGKDIHSPQIPLGEADVLIAFEPAEAVRCLPYLKKGGAAIVSSRAIVPVSSTIGGIQYSAEQMTEYLKSRVERLVLVDTDEAAARLGTSKAVNVALLGAAIRSGGIPQISEEDMEKAVGKLIKPQFLELNMRALKLIEEK